MSKLRIVPPFPHVWNNFVQMDIARTQLMLVLSEQDVDRIVSAAKERAIGIDSFVDSLQYAYELAMSGKAVDEIETALKKG